MYRKFLLGQLGKKKKYPDWRGRYKMFSICRLHDLYVDNFKEFTHKIVLEWISKFSEITGYNISMHKSVICLYTSNE